MNDWLPYSPCPCGCDVTASKLSVKSGHVVKCECHSCRGRRNQRKGKRGEHNRHRNLGGVGFTPQDELGHAYSVEIVTQDKKGSVIPRNFVTFIESEFYRHAISQAERSIPVGVQASPSLYLEPAGGGAFLVVQVIPRKRKAGAA